MRRALEEVDALLLVPHYWDVAKHDTTRLGFVLAQKLKHHSVVALTVFPGFARTEHVESVTIR